eukprot:6204544-Pleurochrysis_carterae.AAC.1
MNTNTLQTSEGTVDTLQTRECRHALGAQNAQVCARHQAHADSNSNTPAVTMECSQARCNFACITKCDKEGLDDAGLRECFKCGKDGMHHHFCATHELTLETAEDPGGPGTSLCAKCAGLLSNEPIVAKEADANLGPAAVPVASDFAHGVGMLDQRAGIAEVHSESKPVEKPGDISLNYSSPADYKKGDDAAPEQAVEEQISVPSDVLQAVSPAGEGDAAPIDTAQSDDVPPPPSIGVGTRLLMPDRADSGVRSGVIFAKAEERVLLCYDDRMWESYDLAHVVQHGTVLEGVNAEGDDVDAEHVAAVLLSKNVNNVNAPAGFLYGTDKHASCNNWEAYRRLGLPPTGSADGSDSTRYGTPCLSNEVCVGDLVTLGKSTEFVHAVTGSVAA